MPRRTIRQMLVAASRNRPRESGPDEEGWLFQQLLSLPGKDDLLISSIAKKSGDEETRKQMVIWLLYLLHRSDESDCALFIKRVRDWSMRTGNYALLDPVEQFEKCQRHREQENLSAAAS